MAEVDVAQALVELELFELGLELILSNLIATAAKVEPKGFACGRV
jgi:hypothetical protein